MNTAEWKQTLRKEILEVIDYGREMTDEEVFEQIDEVILQKDELRLLPVSTSHQLRNDLFDSLRRLDV